MSRHTRFFIAKIAVIVLLAGLVFWSVVRHQAKGTVQFPDGSKLVIRTTTYGTEHFYRYGRLIPRLAAPLLSRQMQRHWGVYVYSRPDETPCLVLWGYWSGAQTSYPPTIITFVDKSGLESEFNWAMTLPNANPNETHLSWKCLNYPRREKILHLKIYQLDTHAKPIYRGALEIANPWNGPFPKWDKPTYPVTNSVNGLNFILLALAADGVPVRGLNPLRPDLLPGQTAVFKVERNGQSTPDWRPIKVEVSDASGNSFTPPRFVTNPLGNLSLLHFSGAMWTDEHVWKLRTTFIKQGSFTSNELITISNVPVPQLSQTVDITNSVKIQGTTKCFLGLEHYQPFPNTELPGENGKVHFRVEGTPTNRWISLEKVWDQNGQAVAFVRHASSRKDWPSSLQIPAGTRVLHFEFAVNEPVVAEFISGLQAKTAVPPLPVK